MREELVRRNYAATTIRAYLKAVEHFRQHVGVALDELGPDGCARRYVPPLYKQQTHAGGRVQTTEGCAVWR